MRGVHGSREGNVQSVHGKSGKAAQKGSAKRRSRAEKVGRLKYIIELLKRLERQIGEIDVRNKDFDGWFALVD